MLYCNEPQSSTASRVARVIFATNSSAHVPHVLRLGYICAITKQNARRCATLMSDHLILLCLTESPLLQKLLRQACSLTIKPASLVHLSLHFKLSDTTSSNLCPIATIGRYLGTQTRAHTHLFPSYLQTGEADGLAPV